MKLTASIRSLNKVSKLVKKYSTSFERLTKTFSLAQKKRVLNDFIKNIEVLHKNGSYKLIIEYNYNIGTELWASLKEYCQANSRVTTTDKELKSHYHFIKPLSFDLGNIK